MPAQKVRYPTRNKLQSLLMSRPSLPALPGYNLRLRWYGFILTRQEK
jgi:hypothetical protein